jgi:hypothetical protein
MSAPLLPARSLHQLLHDARRSCQNGHASTSDTCRSSATWRQHTTRCCSPRSGRTCGKPWKHAWGACWRFDTGWCDGLSICPAQAVEIQHSCGQQHQQEQAELFEISGAVLQSQGDLLILQQCWHGCQSSVSKLVCAGPYCPAHTHTHVRTTHDQHRG